MTEKQFTEKQILAGIFECWSDAMGTERPFDAETRVDLHMKANNEWADTDLADIFYRLEKHFGFESTLEEWTEELGIANVPSLEVWENEIAPRFTFGALARFIQQRAVNTVSFEPVMVINKECRPAGVFYGIEQISDQLISAKCQVTPGTNIIDAFRGYKLDSFWSELSWRSEVRLPRLARHWSSYNYEAYLIGAYGLFFALPIAIITQTLVATCSTATGGAICLAAAFIANLIYNYWSNPLPPELQTFRDLSIWIADHGGDAEWIPANVAPTQS